MKVIKPKTLLPKQWGWGARSLLFLSVFLTGFTVSAFATLIGSGVQIDNLTGADDNASIGFDGANYLVVWQTSTGTSSSSDIYAEVISPAGATIIPSFPVNAAPNDQTYPAVSSNAANRFLIVYQTYNGTDFDISGALVSYSTTSMPNTTTGAPFLIAGGAGNQQYPSVAYDGTGFYVAYVDNGAAVKAVSVSTAGLAGTPVTLGSVASATPPSVLPKIAFSNSTIAKYLVVWEDFTADPSGNIYANTITTTGAVGSVTPVPMAAAASMPERHPSVAFDGTNFMVVYDKGSAGSKDIYGQLVASNLTLSGASFVVSSAANDQGTPNLTFSAGSNLYFAAWQDYRNTATNADIFGARISNAGALIDASGFPLMTNTTFQTQNPVTGNDGSNFLTVWTDFRNPPTGSDIWGQMASGPSPLISTITPNANLTAGTVIAISGNYFGDLLAGSRSTSTNYVSISGVKIPDFNLTQWENASIVFTLPTNSTSGPLQVVSGTLGSNTINLGIQDFTLAASPTSLTVSGGSIANITLTLTSLNSFATPVTLSAAGLPSGVGGAFSANPVIPTTSGASSILTLSVSLSALSGAYTLQVAGVGGGETHAIPVTLNIAALPVVQTSSVTGATQTSATLNGTVNPNGGAATAWFDYGITTLYGSATPTFSLSPGYSQTTLSSVVSGLAPGATYHYRLTAQNSIGTVYGGDVSLITIANPPVTVTGIVSNQTTTSMTLNGTANPNGVPGSAWFEYGATSGYGSATQAVPITGSFDNFVSVNLYGLSPYSTYHFRIVAINNGGTSWGIDQTFNTYSIPFYGQPKIELLTSPATMFNGVNSSDYAGSAVANGGDVNGDGIKDLVICADHALAPANKINAGACYLFFGKPPGWISPTTLDQADLTIYGASANDMLGHSVSITGDLNGDGFADIVIGAPQASPVLKTGTRYNAGQVYVIYGRGNFYNNFPTGVIDLSAQSANVTISGANAFDTVGDAVTTAGDINGDYVSDLVLSAPKVSGNNVAASGQVYILFGKNTLPPLIDLSTTSGGADVIISDFQTNGLSSSISINGDVNGDGMNDLLIGVQGYSPTSKSTSITRYQAGGAFLFYGRRNWPTAGTSISMGNADIIFNGINNGDQAGSAVSLGDLNKDGKADIIIGARLASPNGKSYSGQTYVISGSNPALVTKVVELSGADVTINGVGSGDQSGRTLSSTADLNGDGYMDILIGAPLASPGGRSGAGSVYIILGKSLFPSVINLATTYDTVINGAYAGDSAGSALDASGDINGDLLPDIIIGANNASPALKSYPYINKYAGQAFLIFGNRAYDVAPPTVPSGLSVVYSSDSQIGLIWNPSTDNTAVAGYQVFRNGNLAATVGGTQFTDSGLKPLSQYSYRVQAFDLAGNKSGLSTPLNASTLADTVPPTSPTNLTATATTQTQINLSWSVGTDDIGVAGYQVWRSINGTTYVQIANLTGTTFSSTGLSPSSINYYYVKTVDAAGNSSFPSNMASAVTLDDTAPPSIPSGLHAVTVTAGEIDLWWNPAVDNVGVAGYQIWRSIDNVNFTQIASVTSLTYADTGLTVVQKYYYTVKAYDVSGNISGGSNIGYAVNDLTPPTAPTGVTGAVISPGQINVSWAAGFDNSGVIFQYFIYSSTNNINFTLAGVVGGNSLVFSHTGLSAGTSYYYYVQATDLAENFSPASSTAGPFTTPGDTSVPTAPTGLTAFFTGVTSIGLTWTASTDNSGTIASYQVWRASGISACSSPPSSPFSQAGSTTTTTYADGGLSPGASYSYCVVAADPSTNRSVASNTVNVTTLPDTFPPTVPPFFSATAVSETQINLLWSPSVDNVAVAGYQITRTPGPVLLTSLTTSYSDSGLSPGITYTYAIQAYDFAIPRNYSAASSPVSAVTLDQTKPTLPSTGFSAVPVAGANGASQIILTWPQGADNVAVAGYTVWQSNNNVNFAEIASQQAASGTTYTARGLQPNTTYYFYIIAYDAAGNNSVPSPTFSAATTPDSAPPSAPTNLVVTAAGDSKLSLSWTASTDNVAVASYNIYRSTVSTGPFILIGTSSVNSYTDSLNLASSTTYYYYLVAVDTSAFLSSPSLTASGTTYADTSPPIVPRGVVAFSASNETQVNLSWIPSIDNSGTVAGYHIFRNGIQAGTAISNNFTDSGLQRDQTYIYTITAYDLYGNISALSAPVTVVTDVFAPTVPCADLVLPCILGAPSAVAMNVSEIDISWAPSKDNDLLGGLGSGVAGYKVYRSDLTNPIGTTTANSTIFADKGLAPKTIYNYRISAFDLAGNDSSQSAVAKVTTPADTTPPSVPANLTAALAAPYQINLSWTPSSDNDKVAGYKIYRNGSLYMFTTSTSFADPSLSHSTTFSYAVSAYDRSGNESAQSSAVQATTAP